ncbi:MAG: hypothetical protein EB127_05540 [Alphaproteobacteria bacterium]|nr:hypothetical protein [Alphaproteobacteria bacterium]
MENNSYLVQVGKNKSKYHTRYTFTDFKKAVFYYQCINVGYGYKKRLVDQTNQKTLARCFS